MTSRENNIYKYRRLFPVLVYKIILILITSLILTTSIFSQEYFSKLYDLGRPTLIFQGLIATDTGYYVHGLSTRLNSPYNLGAYLGFYDLEGNEQWSKYLNDTVVEYETWTYPLYDSSCHTIVTAGGVNYNLKGDVVLLQYDLQGSILQKNIIQSHRNGAVTRGAINTSDGGFAFVFQQSQIHGDVSLLKLDSNLQVEWFKVYPLPLTQLPLGLTENKKKEIIIHAYTSNNILVEKNFTWQDLILKIDPLTGEIIDEYITDNDRLLGSGGILALEDGYILGSRLGFEIYLTPTVNGVWWVPLVQKIDTNFNLIWEQTFITNIPTPNIRIDKIIQSESGSVYGVGVSIDTGIVIDQIGLMFKISPQGDSLWLRQHMINPPST